MTKHTYRSTAALPPVLLTEEPGNAAADCSVHIPVLQDPLPEQDDESTTNRLRNSAYAIGFFAVTAVMLMIGVQSISFAQTIVQ